MANPLTGDFDAVLQVSGATVNRLLATMHQRGTSKPELPGFPHAAWIRIGDPVAIDGMRGNILAQASVPRVDLIHDVSDRFWLEVAIRARYIADPGTVPIPEFIHGTLRAQYRIDNIDPDCAGWAKAAADYIWVRAIRNTISFTGTAEDDVIPAMIVSNPIDPSVADARITEIAKFLLMKRFEATPHHVSRRFRRGSMRSLNVGAKRSAVAVPISLAGDPGAGDITSIDQEFLEGKDVAIAVNRDVIIKRIQQQLDKIRVLFKTEFRYLDKTQIAGVDVLTLQIDYTIKLSTATAQWLGGLTPILGVTVPGGLVAIKLTGTARTQKSQFNFDFEVTQTMLITFDASTEGFAASAFGAADVKLSGTFATVIEDEATPAIQAEVASLMNNSASDLVDDLSFVGRKNELVKQLETMDENGSVKLDSATFSADGVVVRGRIGLSARQAPVCSFAASMANDGFTAFASWIPGGRVDSFNWSWKWLNKSKKPGNSSRADRFILRRPPATGKGKFGVQLGISDPLPGLDGMGQVCLAVQGVHVHPVTGELVYVSTSRKCKRFGLDVRVAVPDRLFLREWVPGPRDPIGPVAEVAIHEVSGTDARGHGANTLVVRVNNRWDREIGMSLRDGLAGSHRRDAGLVVLILFGDGTFMRHGGEWLEELDELAREIEAPLAVNEDVGGSWSKALSMEMHDANPDDVELRLLSPTGGITWAHSGPLDARSLSTALDDYLFQSGAAASGHIIRDLPFGTRISGSAFESDIVGALENLEAACPPLPFGLRGIETSVNFLSKGSATSDAVVRNLSSESQEEGKGVMAAVVIDGASADDVEEMRRSLPEGVIAIADPDGSIAKRFGVRVWPTTVSIGGEGIVTNFESGTRDNERDELQGNAI